MSTITTKWTSGGVVREYVSTRNDDETAQEFADRYMAELDGQLSQFPPD